MITVPIDGQYGISAIVIHTKQIKSSWHMRSTTERTNISQKKNMRLSVHDEEEYLWLVTVK